MPRGWKMRDYAGPVETEKLEELFPQDWTLTKKKNKDEGIYWCATSENWAHKVTSKYLQNVLFRVIMIHMHGEDVDEAVMGGVQGRRSYDPRSPKMSPSSNGTASPNEEDFEVHHYGGLKIKVYSSNSAPEDFLFEPRFNGFISPKIKKKLKTLL